MSTAVKDGAILNLPNHLILFPKWTQLVMNTGKVAITGKRAADGYLVQLLMAAPPNSEMPDIAVLNLDNVEEGWKSYNICEPTLICNNKERVLYNPSFVSGKLSEASIYMLYTYINIYSACSLSLL